MPAYVFSFSGRGGNSLVLIVKTTLLTIVDWKLFIKIDDYYFCAIFDRNLARFAQLRTANKRKNDSNENTNVKCHDAIAFSAGVDGTI